MRVDLGEAQEVLTIGKERIGYANVTRRFHDRKPTGKWYIADGIAPSSAPALSPREHPAA